MEIYQLKASEIKRNIEELHQIVFEVTEKCNLRCDYCLYSGIYKGFSGQRTGAVGGPTIECARQL